MKRMNFTDYFHVVKPQYVTLRLKPNNSIRNNSTHKIAKTISSLYQGILHSIKREEEHAIKLFGKEFIFGTKYRYETPVKVSYYVYIEKKRVEFYFIVPAQFQSVIEEKMSDSWGGVTIEEVMELPGFNESASKYQMVYKKEDALSLNADRRNNDLLVSNLNVIDVLEEGDKVGIYYNFIPTSQFGWFSAYKSTLSKVKSGIPLERDKFGATYAFKWAVGQINTLINDISGAFSSGSASKGGDQTVSLLERALDRMNGGKRISECTDKKATATILNTQIIVISESDSSLRQRNNARSLTQSFDTISGDNSLIAKPFKRAFKFTDFSTGSEINKVGDLEASNFLSLAGREVLEKYDCIERIETKETQIPDDLRKGTMCIGVSEYRGNKQDAYLSTDKEYKNLTLVLIGPTRAGKSTLIGNISNDGLNSTECVILFDFIKNCELSQEVSALFPKERVLTIDCSDPAKMQGLGYNEVGKSADPFKRYANAKIQTSQLQTLINSINSDDTRLSAKMERYLASAALVVFLAGGSIKDVFDVLTNHKRRADFIRRVPVDQTEQMEEYVMSLEELNDYSKEGELVGTRDHLIAGIIDRLNKLKANAYMELMLKRGVENNVDLSDEIQKAQLICIKMPESAFPTKGEKDIACTYWATKLWLALQVRATKIPDRSKHTKVNMVIDEIYQVETTEKFLTDKLSQLAKFGVKPIISCHYINQMKFIRQELRSANASYMLISGCDKKNFDELKSELYPFEEEDLLRLPRWNSMNLIKNTDGYARFITKLPRPVSNEKATVQCPDTNQMNDTQTT